MRTYILKSLVIAILFSLTSVSITADLPEENTVVRFGICTDVHKDIMHDADERLAAFINKATASDLDFIIQLGDFCRPYDYNLAFLKIWNSFPGEKYHVLGNHETDGGFTREESIKFLGSPAKYYSFDKNGFHFIILDGNDVNPSPDKASGYPRFIGDEQKKWLINDLRYSKYHTFIFSHQSLEGNGIENREEIRKILEDENSSAGFKKIIACFSGHHHTDYSTGINGIFYIQVNSMSYSWVGEQYAMIRYSEEIDKKYPWIKYTIPYQDPLYAIVEVKKGTISVSGVNSSFVGSGPDELKIPSRPENDKIVPVISSRKLKF
ncbi:MAG TPA: metallophosphoesterase [Bacteroidales bacterium]|nr:metallophosphoesterase [Bacteroidales bacterium]